MLDLQQGATFAQQFQVVRPLAKGGMGAVYVVEQLGTKRERALKLMHPMLVSDPRSRERFEREAQVSARIESDHVVEVIAAGIEPTSGTPWLCMELLRGEELSKRLERGPMSHGEIVEVARQLGHALGAAHRAGIVHRDLKPENLFLATPRREGVPFTLKVLDFGVAALVHEASGKSTATQGVGSPIWMAPEQTNVGSVQPATDVWAVGLLAYHLLTGAFYWKAASTEGSTITALLVEVMVEPLVPASQRAAEQRVASPLPRGFDAWFSRCVVRDPAARFPEAGAAIAELIAVLTGQTPSLAPATAPQAFAATMAVPTSPMGGATGPAATPPAASAGFPANGFPATGAGVAISSPPPTAPMTAATSAPVAAAPPRRIWPWVLGSVLATLLLCGVGIAYTVARGAQELAHIAGPPHLEVNGDHGEHVEITSAGVVVTLPDAGTVVALGSAAPIPPATPETGASEEADDGADGADADHDDVDEPGTPRPNPHRPEAEAVAPDIESAEIADRGERRGRARTSRRALSPTARLLRARLDRCVRGNLEGEPPAEWTFTLRFNRFGTAEAARIVGPRSGEAGGPYGTFRRCVQGDVAGFDAGGDPGPFTLTLP